MSTTFINSKLIPPKETLNDCLWMGYRNDIACLLPNTAVCYMKFFENNPCFLGQDRSIFCANDIKSCMSNYLKGLNNIKLVNIDTWKEGGELDLYFDQLRDSVFNDKNPKDSLFTVQKNNENVVIIEKTNASTGTESTRYILDFNVMSCLGEWYELSELLERHSNMPKKKVSTKITEPQLDHFITSSIRYCVGSHTIATCCHSYGLAKYFSKLLKDRQYKYSRLIIECINRIMSCYDNTNGIIASDAFGNFCEDCAQTRSRVNDTVPKHSPEGSLSMPPEMITDLIPWHRLACACAPQYTVKYAGKPESAFFSYIYNYSTGQIEKVLCGCKNYFDAPSLVSYFDNIFKLEITEIPSDRYKNV